MADALPRERWILAGIVLFVVLGGLFPNATVIEHSSEVDVVDEAIRTFDNLNRSTGDSDNNLSMNARHLHLSATSMDALEVEHAQQRPTGVHR